MALSMRKEEFGTDWSLDAEGPKQMLYQVEGAGTIQIYFGDSEPDENDLGQSYSSENPPPAFALSSGDKVWIRGKQTGTTSSPMPPVVVVVVEYVA